MSRLNNRIQKLERSEGRFHRIESLVKVFMESSPNGPEPTGRAVAVIPGIALPQTRKSEAETMDEFRTRVSAISEKARFIDEMSNEERQPALGALQQLVEEANTRAEQVS